ncbi:MAG TPA: DUF4252 domain-containing protein [Puia sp.]|nr:DUF4252 domain-containing protein [Puia sp.]
MTRCILSVAFLLMVGAGYGQQVSFSTNASFMLQASFHGREDGNWIQKVTQVKVMILDKKKAADVEQWDKLVRELRDQRYEELVSVRKGQDRVRLMSRDGDGVKEVAFLAGDKDGGLYIQFAGKFTQHDLEQMRLSIQDKD